PRSSRSSPPRCESSPPLRDCRNGGRGARPLAFRFSPYPADASGEPSSRPSGGLRHGGTASEPPPTDADERGKGRQFGSRPESARRPDSRSIRRRRPSPPRSEEHTSELQSR